MKMVSIKLDTLFYRGNVVYRIVDVTDEHMRVIRNTVGIIPGLEANHDADEMVRIRRPKAARTHTAKLIHTVDTIIAQHRARLAGDAAFQAAMAA